MSEIRDLARAELRLKLNRDSETEVQVVKGGESLRELETMFRNAEYTGITGCPFTARLLLTRTDGETIILQIATDSCDSMILGTSAGYDYGPLPKGGGEEGTENKQEVLIRIFDEINWQR